MALLELRILKQILISICLTLCANAQTNNKVVYSGVVGKNLICIEIDDGDAEHAVKGFGKVKNATFKVQGIRDPSSYWIKSADDANYKTAQKPLKIGHKAKGSEFVQEGGWKFEPRMRHTIYLQSPKPLKEAASYEIVIAKKASGTANFKVKFKMKSASLRSESIQASQVGYVPGLSKFAFISNWAGTMGGIDFSYLKDKPFTLLNTKGKKVFSGTIKLRRKAGEPGDDAYKSNYQKTDLYEMDFSKFNKKGKYVISVPGLGCSYPFSISRTAYASAYKVTTKGFYYQRCGTELKEKHAGKVWKRKRCHHPGDGKKVQETKHPVSGKGSAFSQLPKNVTGKTLNYWGGWHDAGDWDRRALHLNNAAQLIDVYIVFKKILKDGDLKIPESGNGIPDILDEAIWCIDFFMRGQKADGGVRGGIESEGHPQFNTVSWKDPLHLYAYKEDYYATGLFAWCAAKAVVALSGSKRGKAKAASYKKAAEKAWAWMEKNNDPKQADARNAAAAALYAATGKAFYHKALKETSVWTKNANAATTVYGKYDQGRSAVSYCLYTPKAKVDAKLKVNMEKALLKQADQWVNSANQRAYRFATNMYRPMNWGLTSAPDIGILISAYGINKAKKYANAIATSCSFTTGANALNIVWVSGLGINNASQILHVDSWYQSAKAGLHTVVPGLVPSGTLKFRTKSKGIHGFSQRSFIPDITTWPPINSYTGNKYDPGMNEHTTNSIGSAAQAYAFMYAIGQTPLKGQ
ncbi:MAG: glycoside hydrolase family 9 protein [Lentisphaeria bacterium]|nr:glycoside hydrolase family 9 protein [Lentisphaeria bacterium]NQZ66809.1 glycoside hydrolase family 9 protein [Lentisphaeria bacterium]